VAEAAAEMGAEAAMVEDIYVELQVERTYEDIQPGPNFQKKT